MMLEKIPDVLPVRFGVVVQFCDQRLLTTQEPVFSDPETLDIDRVQNNALDIGTPVRILHESRDGRWWFVHCDVSAGWVEKDKIAVCNPEMIRRFVASPMPVVSIQRRAILFRDLPGARYHGFLRMGAVLPWAGQIQADTVSVWLPRKDSEGNLVLSRGYCPAADVHVGFLQMTARNILIQAFRMLDAPYGWGDRRQAQDCSRFMQEIFATTGLMLPRNSADQAKVLRTAAIFEPQIGCEARKDLIQKRADPGASLLYMKGHILLYIGSIGDALYVIHAAHGYRVPDERTGEDRFIRLSRVVVSDLELGNGSRHGSLCGRLISVHTIKDPEQAPGILPAACMGVSTR
ncbi:SH3 domain-containing protein [Desulfatirhabdium butyrativorans]|uniref:SH3 domain-containing protein n=1 Tax=Desulfatirhabdium butyrativorans TaxID=340467 RepID=UPI0012EBEEBB|nr:SH3 domain-containing protein [Desulfatirhabdium butyrativorans]